MEVYHTEEEQIEQLKSWIRNYGPPFIIGIALALGGGFGWRTWQHHQTATRQAAAREYIDLQNSLATNNETEIRKDANRLIENYTNTPYANWAALSLAKLNVDQEKYADAEKQLRWVMKRAKANSIKQTARLRLARLLIAQKKVPQALNLLKTVDDAEYMPMINEIQGDAYLAQNQVDQAKEAYKKAIAALKQKNLKPPKLLTLKLENANIITA